MPPGDRGPVDEAIENLDRGLTTLHHKRNESGELVRAIAVNGIARTEESSTPASLGSPALIELALRHARPANRVLLVGVGDLATLRLLDKGRTLDVVESNPDVALLARHAGKNGVQVASERSFLEKATPYDLVVFDASPRTDLYALAKSRIGPTGVFAQRMMLASLDESDVFRWVAAARQSFDRVWIYATTRQALLVGCASDCVPIPNDATAFIALGPAAVDRLLAAPPSPRHFAEAPWPEGAAGEPFLFFQRFVDPDVSSPMP